MSVPTQQAWKNQSKSYFITNPATGDLDMNGYNIFDVNALATNTLNVSTIGIISSIGANIGTLSAMVTQTATMIPFSSGVGSIEIGNNAAAPSTASYKLTCAGTTGGGLTATNLDMFAYSPTLPGPVRVATADVSGNWTLGKSMAAPIATMSIATATTLNVTDAFKVNTGLAGGVVLNGSGNATVSNQRYSIGDLVFTSPVLAPSGPLYISAAGISSFTIASGAGAADASKAVSYFVVKTI